jgi:hypothetical protein
MDLERLLNRLPQIQDRFLARLPNPRVRLRGYSVYALGAPTNPVDTAAYMEAVKAKHGGDVVEALKEASVVSDRTIAKAGPLLAFNSILAAIAAIDGSLFADGVVFFLALLSSLLLLRVVYVSWLVTEDYGDPEKNLEHTLRETYTRSVFLTLSILCSVVATLLLMLGFLLE